MAKRFWDTAEEIDWNLFTYAALDPTASLHGEVRGCACTLVDIYCGFSAFAWQTKDGPCRITILDIDLAGNTYSDFGFGMINPDPTALDDVDLNMIDVDPGDNGWLLATAAQIHKLAELTWEWADQDAKARVLPELVEELKQVILK